MHVKDNHVKLIALCSRPINSSKRFAWQGTAKGRVQHAQAITTTALHA